MTSKVRLFFLRLLDEKIPKERVRTNADEGLRLISFEAPVIYHRQDSQNKSSEWQEFLEVVRPTYSIDENSPLSCPAHLGEFLSGHPIVYSRPQFNGYFSQFSKPLFEIRVLEHDDRFAKVEVRLYLLDVTLKKSTKNEREYFFQRFLTQVDSAMLKRAGAAEWVFVRQLNQHINLLSELLINNDGGTKERLKTGTVIRRYNHKEVDDFSRTLKWPPS
jgi:hypothetical protein